MPYSYLLDAENVCSDDIKGDSGGKQKKDMSCVTTCLRIGWQTPHILLSLAPVVQPVSNTFTIWDKTVSQRNSELAGSAYIAATTCSRRAAEPAEENQMLQDRRRGDETQAR